VLVAEMPSALRTFWGVGTGSEASRGVSLGRNGPDQGRFHETKDFPMSNRDDIIADIVTARTGVDTSKGPPRPGLTGRALLHEGA